MTTTGTPPLTAEHLEKLRHVLTTAQRGDYLDNAFDWTDIDGLFATITHLSVQIAAVTEALQETQPYLRKTVDDTEIGKAMLCSLCNAWDDNTHTTKCPFHVLQNPSASASSWIAEREALRAENRRLEYLAERSSQGFLAADARTEKAEANQRTPGTVEVCLSCGASAHRWHDCAGVVTANCPLKALRAQPEREG